MLSGKEKYKCKGIRYVFGEGQCKVISRKDERVENMKMATRRERERERDTENIINCYLTTTR